MNKLNLITPPPAYRLKDDEKRSPAFAGGEVISRFVSCRQLFVSGFFFVFALIFGLTCFSHAQILPFENKAKYEKMLEEKIDAVLIKILGPGQAKIVVDATLDFTRTEKFKVRPDIDANEKEAFKWQGIGGKGVRNDYLLPGFPTLDAASTENKSYDKQFLYPSTFVKKLDITVMLNKNVSDEDAANIRIIVSRLLMVDIERGDSLSIVKASFAPFWETIWYTPAALSMVLKYVILTIMGIIAMVVVSIGFLRLAGAMSTMAKVQQSHQITMDLGKGGKPPTGEDGEELGALPEIGGKSEEYAGEEELDADDENKRIIFNVRHDQVIFLVNMMIKEDPSNVALILTHLAPNIRADFLKKLPSKFASEIIANMSKVRFVEPDTILVLKEEVEKRLSGAVGGVARVIETLEGVSLKTKKEMIEELHKEHPDIAVQVKKNVLLVEDLALCSDKDLSTIISKIKTEEWATAMWDIVDPLRQRIREQMADKTWQMIEQSMSYGSPSPERINQSLEKIIETVFTLIKEGHVLNPLETENQMITNDIGERAGSVEQSA